jgi:hypothetical protein
MRSQESGSAASLAGPPADAMVHPSVRDNGVRDIATPGNAGATEENG